MSDDLAALRWLQSNPAAADLRRGVVGLMGAVEGLLSRCSPDDLRALGEERAAAVVADARRLMEEAERMVRAATALMREAEADRSRARRALAHAERMNKQAKAAKAKALGRS